MADGAAPYRSDLDSHGLPDALSNIVLIERISSVKARIWISGRYRCDVLHEDGRSLPYFLLFHVESRSLALDILGQVFDTKCLKTLWLGCTQGNWSEKITLYPLPDAYGVTNMLVAGIEGSALSKYSVNFYPHLKAIPVTARERKMPLNFFNVAYLATMVKSRA